MNTKDLGTRDDLVLKLSGKVEIPSELEIGHNYALNIKCSVTAITEADRFDGGRIKYYKIEPVFIDLITEIGKTITAKDPRKNSAKIRNLLWKEHFTEGGIEDFNKVYDEATWVILSMIPQIYRDAIKRLENKND